MNSEAYVSITVSKAKKSPCAILFLIFLKSSACRLYHFWTKQLKKLRQFSVEFTFFVPFEKKLAQRKGFNQMILIVLVILVDGIDQVIEKQIVIPWA